MWCRTLSLGMSILDCLTLTMKKLRSFKTKKFTDIAWHPRSPEPSTTSLWEPPLYVFSVHTISPVVHLCKNRQTANTFTILTIISVLLGTVSFTIFTGNTKLAPNDWKFGSSNRIIRLCIKAGNVKPFLCTRSRRMGSRGIALLTLNLSTSWRWVASTSHPSHLNPGKEHLVVTENEAGWASETVCFYEEWMRLGEPQSRSVLMKSEWCWVSLRIGLFWWRVNEAGWASESVCFDEEWYCLPLPNITPHSIQHVALLV